MVAGELRIFDTCAKVSCGVYTAGPAGLAVVDRPGQQILFGENVTVSCWADDCYRAGNNTREARRCVCMHV